MLILAASRNTSNVTPAVIWLNGKDDISLKQTLAYIAERTLRQHPSTFYTQRAVKDKELDQMACAMKRWLEESRNSNWLVVSGNYDNPRFGNFANDLDNRTR
jgi:hypothetical protein